MYNSNGHSRNPVNKAKKFFLNSLLGVEERAQKFISLFHLNLLCMHNSKVQLLQSVAQNHMANM